ncbi:Crp/Fnr family transcriptional regulator [Xanthovirga aplysinae]|uniref:Crp/Fnr family transcriptional regulator n=1 Tax=Xanthovirga aplysinae TaxID=2529853 RepID=UPI0012BD28F8|nr:Crp/Fnr family transcriptional regulator [Xanthovirga aplysinae]MTI31118.1 Crp/Fnr family transcriptional regulator [Xanthovirga aplysinae]
MKNTRESIISISQLDNASIDHLLKLGSKRILRKGKVLFHPKSYHHYLHIIESGVVRAYTHYKGKEVTFWLGMEGDIVFPYRTYMFGKTSYETVELLEDCLFHSFLIKDLLHLFESDLKWATWGRKLAEKELIKMEERFISYLFKTAKERYNQLIEQKPEIFNRIQLQHIASYLGMTQVSLSRIRGEY